jgi:hypothetical protein
MFEERPMLAGINHLVAAVLDFVPPQRTFVDDDGVVNAGIEVGDVGVSRVNGSKAVPFSNKIFGRSRQSRDKILTVALGDVML